MYMEYEICKQCGEVFIKEFEKDPHCIKCIINYLNIDEDMMDTFDFIEQNLFLFANYHEQE